MVTAIRERDRLTFLKLPLLFYSCSSSCYLFLFFLYSLRVLACDRNTSWSEFLLDFLLLLLTLIFFFWPYILTLTSIMLANSWKIFSWLLFCNRVLISFSLVVDCILHCFWEASFFFAGCFIFLFRLNLLEITCIQKLS